MKEIIIPSHRWDEEEEYDDIHNPEVILRDIREKFSEESEEIIIIDPAIIEKEILELKERLVEVEHEIAKKFSKAKKTMSKGELVYDKLQHQIEKQYMGKVVAIDVGNKKVIGIGNSIEEAHDDAICKSKKKRFYFKKVGQKHSSSI